MDGRDRTFLLDVPRGLKPGARALQLSRWSTAQVAPSPAMKTPHRILFVGNSFTYYNGGLENHFRQLAESARPPRVVVADRVTKGGATLKILQGLEEVHSKIREGHYDVVVLQDDIPELTEHDVAPFLE